MKTLALDLTPEQDDLLHRAAAAGMTPSEFAVRRLFADDEHLGFFTEMASEGALATIWDSPDEDEAWRHLQPGTS